MTLFVRLVLLFRTIKITFSARKDANLIVGLRWLRGASKQSAIGKHGGIEISERSQVQIIKERYTDSRTHVGSKVMRTAKAIAANSGAYP